MDSRVHFEADRLQIIGDMTVYTAASLAGELAAALTKHAASDLELSGVEEFDTAGLQLLLAAKRQNASLGRSLRVHGSSPAVASVMQMCRLSDLLEPQAPVGVATEMTP